MTAHLLAALGTSSGVAPAIAALAGCLLLYLAYKLFYRADFGLPVRRRIMARGLRVRRDQFAEVPLWWSNLQVQRAIGAHWKQSLRDTVTRPGPAGAELAGRASSSARDPLAAERWRVRS